MTKQPEQRLGTIDIVREGYAVVHRRPWILIIPLILNGIIVFGAQLSLRPLIEELGAFVEQLQRTGATQDMAAVREMVAVYAASDWRQSLIMIGSVPVIPLRTALGGDSVPIELDTIGAAIAAFGVINIGLLASGAAYLAIIIAGVLSTASPPEGWMQRIAAIAAGQLAAALIIGAAGLLIVVPALVLISLLMVIFQPIGVLLLIVLTFAFFWVGIVLSFTNEVIALTPQNPLHAIRTSASVVWRAFWPTIGFLALTGFVIPSGASVIWEWMAGSSAGQIIAIIGAAYISSGLAAARIIFVGLHTIPGVITNALAVARPPA